jgi:hypothetical protein
MDFPTVGAVEENDHRGETWAEIVGSVTMMRIATVDSDTPTDDDTGLVPAAKFSGMLTSFITKVVGEVVLETNDETNDFADGRQHPGNYEGIPGTVFCAGRDCGVTINADGDRLLSGSWYFTPGAPKAWYVYNEDTETYDPETQYAKFGYWLAAAAEGRTAINTFAKAGTATTSTDFNTNSVNTDPTATTLTDARATYTGDAIGMSLHKVVTPQGGVEPGTLQSGQFTADVELTAIFGAAAALEGTIDNFRSDNAGAVDGDWEVSLLRTAGFEDGSFGTNNEALDLDTAGMAVGTALQDGYWTADSYGSSEMARPEGIYGTFNAHFTDGHVAGAYATTKQ